MHDNSLVPCYTFSVPRNLFQLYSSPGVLKSTTTRVYIHHCLDSSFKNCATVLHTLQISSTPICSIPPPYSRSAHSLTKSDCTADHATCSHMLTLSERPNNRTSKLSRCKQKSNKRRSSRCSPGKNKAINWRMGFPDE